MDRAASGRTGDTRDAVASAKASVTLVRKLARNCSSLKSRLLEPGTAGRNVQHDSELATSGRRPGDRTTRDNDGSGCRQPLDRDQSRSGDCSPSSYAAPPGADLSHDYRSLHGLDYFERCRTLRPQLIASARSG